MLVIVFRKSVVFARCIVYSGGLLLTETVTD